jgi:hypothetical protein
MAVECRGGHTQRLGQVPHRELVQPLFDHQLAGGGKDKVAGDSWRVNGVNLKYSMAESALPKSR